MNTSILLKREAEDIYKAEVTNEAEHIIGGAAE